MVQTGASKATLKLTSAAPITEPAINLMLEFSWRGGRILQKYPVLLDPPK
jgi:pilus assembly protein FimV